MELLTIITYKTYEMASKWFLELNSFWNYKFPSLCVREGNIAKNVKLLNQELKKKHWQITLLFMYYPVL
jgi:hypothetical protein